MPSKRVLITGGGGLLGANLTRYYVDRGYKVFLLLEHSPELWRLQDILPLVTVYSADVRDYSAIKSIFFQVRPQIVLHCAGYGRFSFQNDAERMYGVNFYGTINVLQAAKEVGFECFINTGSWQEYGMYQDVVTEKTMLAPVTDFGVSKAAATQFCLKEAFERDLPVYTIRPFFMYGNYESATRLITTLLLSGINQEKTCVSSPQRRYDFIHIFDVVDLYATVERIRPKDQYVFNAATGIGHTVEELVEFVKGLFGSQFEYCWGQKKPELDDYIHCLASIDSLKKQFGWEPNFSLQRGIREYSEWLQENVSLYKGLTPATHERESISMI